MQKVLTVTLNPCIDKMASVEKLTPYALNRIKPMRADPAGKGVNVARILCGADVDVLACGFIAGEYGKILLNAIRDYGIASEFYEVKGETRVNLKLFDESVKKITEINEPGFKVDAKTLDRFLKQFDSLSKDVELVVLGGSLPVGAPSGYYAEIIRLASKNGAKTILDADGAALTKGVSAVPYALKLNLSELSQLAEHECKTADEAAEFAGQLVAKGIKTVLVSVGGGGVVIIDAEKSIVAKPPYLERGSSTGSGDSMVAALAYSILKGFGPEKTARFAAAAGSLTASLPGTRLCSLEDAMKYFKDIDIDSKIGIEKQA